MANRSLTNGALMTTITVVLFLISYYQPFLFFLSFVWATPLAILVARQGIKAGILASISTMAILSLLTSYLVLPMVLPPILINLVIGYGFFKEIRSFVMGISIAVVGIFAIVFSIFASFYALGLTDINSIVQMITNTFRENAKTLFHMGLMGHDLSLVEGKINEILRQIFILIPATIIMAGVVYGGISYYIAIYTLKKVGYIIKNMPKPVRDWHFPKYIIYLSILSTLGIYWGPKLEVDIIYILSMNLFQITNMVALLDGIGIMSYYRSTGKIGKKLFIIILMLCFMNSWLLNILIFLGYLDIVMDFRKIRQKT